MYVVRRPFRNYGKIMEPGSIIIEPGTVKRFKARLKDRYIVEVTKQTFNNWSAYFKTKLGVDLMSIEDATKLITPAEPEQPNHSVDLYTPAGTEVPEEVSEPEVSEAPKPLPVATARPIE